MVYEAAVKAVEATDKAIGIVYEACKKNGYVLFITADHGNAEKMVSDDGKQPFTAHTTARGQSGSNVFFPWLKFPQCRSL